MMSQDEKREYELMRSELDQERIRRMNVENDFNSQQGFSEGKNSNIIEFQLDLKEELDRIYHLLKGDIITTDGDGNEKWISPDDDRLIILSDYGVKQIMNILSFYINKNTLLSNYDEETIFWKVRDFGIEISDLVYWKYEDFFYYPSVEKLMSLCIKLIRKNPELYYEFLIKYDNGLMQIDELVLYKYCSRWSALELQKKLRHYPIIILSLVDSVHSTYLRALNGEERESLRKDMKILHTDRDYGMGNQKVSKFSMLKPSTWK